MFDDKDLETLVEILRQSARAEILPRYRALAGADTAEKTSAQDLVTVADTGMERAVTRAVAERFPDWQVIGEEAVFDDPRLLDRIGEAETALILDPIDGTWNFAHGVPLFAVLAAITRRGETIGGLIYDPIADDYVCALRGAGARAVLAGGRVASLKVAAPGPLEEMSGFLGLSLFAPEVQAGLATAALHFTRVNTLRCAAYEYRLLAHGAVSFSLAAHLKPWDHAAGLLIHAEAGGHAALIDGTPYAPTLREGRLLVAPDADSWEALRAHFRQAAPALA